MKLTDKAKKIIGAVAPGLGAALGGPLGGLAGNMIADALGGEGNVEQAIASQKPEVLLALKNADQAFTAKMRELEIDEQRLYVEDRQDARALAKTDMRPHMALSAFFILGYFGMLLALLSGELALPQENRDVFVALIGILSASVTAIMQFWFGSSIGSAQKTDMLKGRA